MGKRRKGRPIDGVIIIDKGPGMTSNDVVQRTKRLFFAAKAGHTGSLDPLATGVLPVCLGESTKFSQYLLDADKTYESTFCFGRTTDTADADGKTVREADASQLTSKMLENAIAQYRGDIEQVPPMYSALKKDGQPLYKLAREGIEIEREARPVTIYRFELISLTVDGLLAKAKVLIACSKGTYVRSLAEDLGRDLEVGCHVETLRRIKAGPYAIEQAISLEDLEAKRGEQRAESLDELLLPVDSPVSILPKLCLDDDSGFYFMRGQAVMDTEVYRLGDEGDKVRVFQESGEFLGVGEITGEGSVSPKRLVATNSAS
ncbi:tRNA pseudouridine synthase B [Thalassocella blandensis]|nr:tRNA pseudouridine synthase B [Thalassocella blandensis]